MPTYGTVHDFVEHDTTPALVLQCLDQDGAAIDLTGCTVAMHYSLKGSPWRERAVTVTVAATGMISYTWLADDLDAAGTAELRFIITTTATGKIRSSAQTLTISVLGRSVKGESP